jgi:acid phosphatase type 7
VIACQTNRSAHGAARRCLVATVAVAAFSAPHAEPAAAAVVSLSPGVAVPGKRVAVRGVGFAKRKKGSVRLAGTKKAVPLRTDRLGGFALSLRVPATLGPGSVSAVATVGKVRVRLPLSAATAVVGPSMQLVSSRGPRVLVSPLSGQRFSQISIAGFGYRPGVRIDLAFAGYRVGTAHADAAGAFTLQAGVPRSPSGKQALAMTARRASFFVPYWVSPPPVQRPPSGDPTLAAAGDIACSPGAPEAPASCQQTATAALLDALSPTVIAPLGDVQYDIGHFDDFMGSFDATWGAFRPIMRPVPGNHEYLTPGAQGYYRYFGPLGAGTGGTGYYSYDVGAWHLVALDSNCRFVTGGCGRGSPQESWLRSDLAAHANRCTLAYWHHPMFSSNGFTEPVQDLWQALYDGGADVVLTAHTHAYERFAPQNTAGAADPTRGIREFVVGTGGKAPTPFPTGPAANTEVRDNTSFGLLLLTLHDASYDWKFVPTAGGRFTDSGSGACH